jgi:hypothetical protein
MKQEIIAKFTVSNPIIKDDPKLSEIVVKILSEALDEFEALLKKDPEDQKAEKETHSAPTLVVGSKEIDPNISNKDQETIELQQKEIDTLLSRIKKIELLAKEKEVSEDKFQENEFVTSLPDDSLPDDSSIENSLPNDSSLDVSSAEEDSLDSHPKLASDEDISLEKEDPNEKLPSTDLIEEVETAPEENPLPEFKPKFGKSNAITLDELAKET